MSLHRRCSTHAIMAFRKTESAFSFSAQLGGTLCQIGPHAPHTSPLKALRFVQRVSLLGVQQHKFSPLNWQTTTQTPYTSTIVQKW